MLSLPKTLDLLQEKGTFQDEAGCYLRRLSAFASVHIYICTRLVRLS